MTKLFETPAELATYIFRITDNCGQSADRYTVAFTDGSYLALSSHPTSPVGVSMVGEDLDPQVMREWVDEGEAIDLALGDLPEGHVEHIMARCNQGFSDFVRRAEARDETIVAKTRKDAKENTGSHISFGEGIYTDDYIYFYVKREGMDIEDDLGPYLTVREALLATVPDAHSVSGPEYHSSTDVSRMEPDDDIATAVRALEEKNDEDYRNGGLRI